jgi:hypothetical protein
MLSSSFLKTSDLSLRFSFLAREQMLVRAEARRASGKEHTDAAAQVDHAVFMQARMKSMRLLCHL